MELTLEQVLAQDDWLRSIAGALVRDPSTAEDLVQDAWLAGLEKRRSGAEARSWFRGLLRNRRRAHHRSRRDAQDHAHRLVREGGAAVGVTQGLATDEIVDELQLRERIARELVRLDEPLRVAVYMRFVEGLSNKEIARRTGVVPSAASQRVTRGLAQLRKRLDVSHPGGRRAWAPVLSGFAGGGKVGSASFATSAFVVATVMAVGGIAWAGHGLWSEVESHEVPLPSDGTQREARLDVVRPTDGTGMSRVTRGAVVDSPAPVRVPQAQGGMGQGSVGEGTGLNVQIRISEPILFGELCEALDPTRVWLVSASRTRRALSSEDPSAKAHVFKDVAAGGYTVEIEDPRFDGYVSRPVMPGGFVDVELTGSASLGIDARTPEGHPASDLSLELTYSGIRSTLSTFDAGLTAGVADGLVPWRYDLKVLGAEGTAVFEGVELAPGEHRVLEVNLVPRIEVSGTLMFPDGQPATGVPVRLVVPARVNDGAGEQILPVDGWQSHPHGRIAIREVEAGVHGDFVLHADEHQSYVVVAGRDGAPQVETRRLELGESGDVTDVALVIPRGGFIDGLIVTDGGDRHVGGQVLCFDTEKKSARPLFPEPVRVRKDGFFSVGPLPPGSIGLYFFDRGHRNIGADMMGRPVGGLYLGTETVLENQRIDARLEIKFEVR